MNSKQQKALLQGVRSSLSTVQELEQTVSHFSGDQNLLDSQVNSLIASLKDLQSKKDLCGSTEIPIDILRALDTGSNPDISTLNLFKQGLQENQATKGKVAALEDLRNKLSTEIQQAYPEAAQSYQNLKAAAPADTSSNHVVDPRSASNPAEQNR